MTTPADPYLTMDQVCHALRDEVRSLARDALWLLAERQRQQRGGLVDGGICDRCAEIEARLREAAR